MNDKPVVKFHGSGKLAPMRYIRGLIMTATALTALAEPGLASARVDAPPLEISMPGDADMDCARISQEVGLMDHLITASYSTQAKSDQTSVGVNVAKTIGSVLIGTLTGTIGFMAAGHLAAEAADHRSEVAAESATIALQRRSLMVGMFQAKRCEGPLPEAPRHAEKLWPDLGGPEPAPSPQTVEPAAGESPAENPAVPALPRQHDTKHYND